MLSVGTPAAKNISREGKTGSKEGRNSYAYTMLYSMYRSELRKTYVLHLQAVGVLYMLYHQNVAVPK